MWLVSRTEYVAQMVSIQRGNPFIRFHSRKKTGEDTKLGSDLCEDRPKWSSSNSSFLYSDHFDENCFTKNQEIAAKLGMKRKLKLDAVPTIDLSLIDSR